ncbi:MAG: hypothetical protein K2Q20_12070 [Phycisphaerales bacterium]|nr:hypothetical protein [Phycisphaerales bacterium]
MGAPAFAGPSSRGVVSSEWARRVADRLRTEFGRVLGALPATTRTSTGLARHLSLKQPLCHRLIAAVRAPVEPGEFFLRIPGPEGLTTALDAARRAGVDVDVLQAGTAAVREFETLIQHAGGSQRRLVAAIREIEPAPAPSDQLDPYLLSRRTAYEACSHLLGSSAKATVHIVAYAPVSATHIASRGALGKIGIVRTPGCMPLLASHTGDPSRSIMPPATDGGGGGGGVGVLASFTTPGIPQLVRSHAGLSTLLFDPDVSITAPIDIVAGPFASGPSESPLAPDAEGRAGGRAINCYVSLRTPSRWLVMDVYLHRSLAARSLASSAAFLSRSDLARAGVPTPAERWPERAPGTIELRVMQPGEIPDGPSIYPRHAELTRAVFAESGWTPADFVGHRVLLPYPMMGLDYLISFDFPRE